MQKRAAVSEKSVSIRAVLTQLPPPLKLKLQIVKNCWLLLYWVSRLTWRGFMLNWIKALCRRLDKIPHLSPSSSSLTTLCSDPVVWLVLTPANIHPRIINIGSFNGQLHEFFQYSWGINFILFPKPYAVNQNQQKEEASIILHSRSPIKTRNILIWFICLFPPQTKSGAKKNYSNVCFHFHYSSMFVCLPVGVKVLSELLYHWTTIFLPAKNWVLVSGVC